ncbi:MAG: PadR family transcriptional regulator [Chloroflexi bacterium]|nr:PadR family transcriptional regulator [Chloroflexota bacterium]MBU1747208.1 PadR family transcriptional regulator [Chloroflexota bacterium]MBU1880320.1 PadR family transcriptional regulator [Chloroflexota bacterium]
MPRGRHCHRGQARAEAGPCPRRIQRFVEPVLLLLLHRDASHGYNLLDGLRELGLEDYPTDTSALYRALRDLEEQEMVTSLWDTDSTAGPPRRVYRLTEAGDRYLTEWVADLRATDHILHRFLDAYDEHMAYGDGEHHE